MILSKSPKFFVLSDWPVFPCFESARVRQPPYELVSNYLRGCSLLGSRCGMVHGVVRENLGGRHRATWGEAPKERHGSKDDRQFHRKSRRGPGHGPTRCQNRPSRFDAWPEARRRRWARLFGYGTDDPVLMGIEVE